MTILSDRQIAELCTIPTSIREYPKDPNTHIDGMSTLVAWDHRPYDREPTEEEIEAFRPMIAPFYKQQVRQVTTAYDEAVMNIVGDQQQAMVTNTRKIISKGLTSYGYDVSLALGDVKVFTNINAGEIDPKHLDTKCLADATIRTDVDGAKYFLLPPHSYALASTVEYFRMPRDTIAVCLGKSTYARAGIQINATPIEPGFEGNVVIEIFNSVNLPSRVYLEEGISQFLFFQGAEPCLTSYGDRGGKYQGQTGVTLPKV